MAAIRIQFPGRKEISVIALTGPRITVGRSPDNTIQVVDRTMSVRHAELIESEGHYRLHDLDSTNGVFVNGRQVADYHLHEQCKLAFGTFECEFLPALPNNGTAVVEALPSRADVGAVVAENSELKSQATKLREEINGLRVRIDSLQQAGESAVPSVQHETILVERDHLRATVSRMEKELAQVQAELTKLRMDRDDLQRERAELRSLGDALPSPAFIESLRAENALLQARLEAATGDLGRLRAAAACDANALISLRAERERILAEHVALRDAHDRRAGLEEEFMAELASLRAVNAELKSRFEAQARDLTDLQNARASLAMHAASLVTPEEYAKLAADHASAADARWQLQQELTRVRQELASRTADYETLQRICSRQRNELERSPAPTELESLRAAKTELEARVEALDAELESLRSHQAVSARQLAASVPRPEHERLVAEHASLRKNRVQREAELAQLQRQFDELQTRHVTLELEIRTLEQEVAALRARSSAPSEEPAFSPSKTSGGLDEQLPGGEPAASGQLEEILGKLGFRIQPIRLPARAPDGNGGVHSADPSPEAGQPDRSDNAGKGD